MHTSLMHQHTVNSGEYMWVSCGIVVWGFCVMNALIALRLKGVFSGALIEKCFYGQVLVKFHVICLQISQWKCTYSDGNYTWSYIKHLGNEWCRLHDKNHGNWIRFLVQWWLFALSFVGGWELCTVLIPRALSTSLPISSSCWWLQLSATYGSINWRKFEDTFFGYAGF